MSTKTIDEFTPTTECKSSDKLYVRNETEVLTSDKDKHITYEAFKAQIQSDFNLHPIALTGEYSALENKPTIIVGEARLVTTQFVTSLVAIRVLFDADIRQEGINYADGVFTVQKKGTYDVYVNIGGTDNGAGPMSTAAFLYKNDSIVARAVSTYHDNGEEFVTLSLSMDCEIGDTIEIKAVRGGVGILAIAQESKVRISSTYFEE